MKCSICKAEGVTMTTCPMNPKAKNPNPLKHKVKKASAPKLERGQVKKNTEKWVAANKPKTKKQREVMARHCQSDCFLVPEALKYPVCTKSSCKINCDGVRAARNQATIVLNRTSLKNPKESKAQAKKALVKANALGKKHCDWTQKAGFWF